MPHPARMDVSLIKRAHTGVRPYGWLWHPAFGAVREPPLQSLPLAFRESPASAPVSPEKTSLRQFQAGIRKFFRT